MTSPADDVASLRSLLAGADALLLDFDGPMCSVFLGIPAHIVANQLRDLLNQSGHTDLPHDIRAADDPFDVLRYSAKLGPSEARHIEAAFRAHEVEAVQVTRPTPGAHELLRSWKATGRPLAIVSNNSAAAVEVYLARFDLTDLIDCVSARTSPDTLLKPSPALVASAVKLLNIPAPSSILVGDSVTDIEAAHKAGTRSIGYANKPGKEEHLLEASPDAVIASLKEIQRAIH